MENTFRDVHVESSNKQTNKQNRNELTASGQETIWESCSRGDTCGWSVSAGILCMSPPQTEAEHRVPAWRKSLLVGKGVAGSPSWGTNTTSKSRGTYHQDTVAQTGWDSPSVLT